MKIRASYRKKGTEWKVPLPDGYFKEVEVSDDYDLKLLKEQAIENAQENHYLIRFEKQDVTTYDVSQGEGVSSAARKSLLGIEGAGITTDYKNDEVLAVWRYSSTLDWGVISKIDSAEAFAPINQLQQDIIILALVFTFGIGVFGITAAKMFSRPSIRLTSFFWLSISPSQTAPRSSVSRARSMFCIQAPAAW